MLRKGSAILVTRNRQLAPPTVFGDRRRFKMVLDIARVSLGWLPTSTGLMPDTGGATRIPRVERPGGVFGFRTARPKTTLSNARQMHTHTYYI